VLSFRRRGFKAEAPCGLQKATPKAGLDSFKTRSHDTRALPGRRLADRIRALDDATPQGALTQPRADVGATPVPDGRVAAPAMHGPMIPTAPMPEFVQYTLGNSARDAATHDSDFDRRPRDSKGATANRLRL